MAMSLQWRFREKAPGEDITNPVSGEFFADGSLDNVATALVREALQNSLDARIRMGEQVRVRIGIHRRPHGLDPAAADLWFRSLRPHLAAPGNGLRDAPDRDEHCDFLTLEDFGTTGLTGDIESDSVDDERNNFVDFLRSDGWTRKGSGDRGSWGVGKSVFFRASRINSFIAYTVRNTDGRRLLMGKCLLKVRRAGGAQYRPECYLAESWRPGEVPRPSEQDATIQRFASDFGLARRSDSGLSVVVPWVDDDIRYADLFRAVVDQFYLPILDGYLTMELVNGDKATTLEAANLVEQVSDLGPETVAAVELARWARTEAEPVRISAPDQERPQKWSEDLLTDDSRRAIWETLEKYGRAAVRVPVAVRRSGTDDPTPSHFDVFLAQHDGPRTPPAFFRQELRISSVKRAVGVDGIRSLVIIDDAPLADLLRAAEPPNHTDWDIKTANFRHAYRDGNHVVTFVKSSVKQIMALLRTEETAATPVPTADFFFVDLTGSAPGGSGNGKKPGRKPAPPFPGIPRRPPSHAIHAIEGGFWIGRGDPDAARPRALDVVLAYDVQVGSPWKQFDARDFDLRRVADFGIQIHSTGCSCQITGANRIRLVPEDDDFILRVTGFDPLRDLIVRAFIPGGHVSVDTAPQLYEAEEA